MKRNKGLEVEIYPDTIAPEKLIITAYYSDSNEPLNNHDIELELDNNCTWIGMNEAGYIYLTDEAGFRYITSIYPMSRELERDLENLISGEIEKLEYYRDIEFLKPCDIEEAALEHKKFEIDRGKIYKNCILHDYLPENGKLQFFDEEMESIVVDFDNTEIVKILA